MNNHFQPIQLLQNAANEGKTGHLQITANQVKWDFYFVEGMLQYATHSLQSLDTIQYYLFRHNQEATAKIIPTLAQNIPQTDQSIPTIIKQLAQQNYLTSDNFAILITNLIKDAVESYLWLREGEYHWHNAHQTSSFQKITLKEDNLLAISNLLDNVIMRMKTWQKFSDVITSPYQRLFCANPSLIQQKVPSGNLNPTSLEKLVKLMQGKTLRQISLFLKQDELKVAQLLLPYFKHNILQLRPPQSPLDKLPPILPLTPADTTNNQKMTSQPSVKVNHHQSSTTKPEKIYKIVCIDDSPSILDMIKAYLSGEQFEVFTVDNPTQSLPCLFECKPDLILIDFSMPGINGNKLCRIIKGSSFFKNTPIIMISGNSKMLTRENIQAAGATDYLAKPFTKEVLKTMINKYLRTNTKINQQLSQPRTDTDFPLIPADQANIELSEDSTRKPVKIAQTHQDIDPVTQLPNRQCFDQYLSVVVKNAQKTQSSFSLMFVKIDNFTDIQATLGQTGGDKVLQYVAKHVQSLVRANDVVARWRNNEFVIFFSNVKHPKILEKISQRILNTIQPTPLLSEHQLALELSQTVKIGSYEVLISR